jgi:hypothetical protein
METWKIIPNFSKFEVADYGQVRNSKTGRLLKNSTTSGGYLKVSLKSDAGQPKTVYTNLAVLTAFFGEEIPGNATIIHRDGLRENCRLINLGWVTLTECVYVVESGDGYELVRIPVDVKGGPATGAFCRNGHPLVRRLKVGTRFRKIMLLGYERPARRIIIHSRLSARYWRHVNDFPDRYHPRRSGCRPRRQTQQWIVLESGLLLQHLTRSQGETKFLWKKFFISSNMLPRGVSLTPGVGFDDPGFWGLDAPGFWGCVCPCASGLAIAGMAGASPMPTVAATTAAAMRGDLFTKPVPFLCIACISSEG